MANLKLQIEVNKGKRGISLDKLEHLVQEMRKFLGSMGEDIDLHEPTAWVGVDFKNGSLGFATEYSYPVAPPKLSKFNDAIMALARSEFPSSIRKTTANQFFQLASVLDQDEIADMAVFDETNTAVPLEISQRTAILARMITVLPFRQALGALQGKIHALYKESKPDPYFQLRELSTGDLIKCVYGAGEYPAIVRALEVPDQVLHVRGLVVTDTRGRCIHHVQVRKILLADSYGYEDVEKFLHSDGAQ